MQRKWMALLPTTTGMRYKGKSMCGHRAGEQRLRQRNALDERIVCSH